MSENEAGPSTLRARKAPPPSLEQRASSSSSSTSNTGRDDSREKDEQPASARSGHSGHSAAGSVNFPGGLPLPAVKGTIGGIESPRRTHGYSSSISSTTVRDDQPPTPLSSSTLMSQQNASSASEHDRNGSAAPPAPPSAVFRADPTVKSCLLDVKLEAKAEIARLFGVA